MEKFIKLVVQVEDQSGVEIQFGFNAPKKHQFSELFDVIGEAVGMAQERTNQKMIYVVAIVPTNVPDLELWLSATKTEIGLNWKIDFDTKFKNHAIVLDMRQQMLSFFKKTGTLKSYEQIH